MVLNSGINIIPLCLDVVTPTEQTRTKLLGTQQQLILRVFLELSNAIRYAFLSRIPKGPKPTDTFTYNFIIQAFWSIS